MGQHRTSTRRWEGLGGVCRRRSKPEQSPRRTVRCPASRMDCTDAHASSPDPDLKAPAAARECASGTGKTDTGSRNRHWLPSRTVLTRADQDGEWTGSRWRDPGDGQRHDRVFLFPGFFCVRVRHLATPRGLASGSAMSHSWPASTSSSTGGAELMGHTASMSST